MPGLSKAERASQGRKGGVVRLIYIAGLAVDTGFDMMAPGAGNGTPTPFTVEDVCMLWPFRSWLARPERLDCLSDIRAFG